jgi:hypothetical protein
MIADIDALVAEARDWQRRWSQRWVTPGTEVLVGSLLDALTAERAKAEDWQAMRDERDAARSGYANLLDDTNGEIAGLRAKVAALEAQLEAERALCAHSREPDVWRLNKEQSQQFAEAVLAAMEEPHGKG